LDLDCGFKKILFAIKFQISSTKLQTNLKFQNSMTKTFTVVIAPCIANPAFPEISPLGALLKADNLLVCKAPIGVATPLVS